MDSRTPRYIGEPWPAATDHNTPEVVPTTDVPAYLRWLAARGDAWIPTLTELTQAENQRNATIREHRINRAASAALTA